MEEKYQILFCLQRIEEKLNWKPHAEWKDYEFTLLKKDIQVASGINISTHTLKRLFGKLKYRTDYRPQHATKDALAVYLGYGSWEEFIQENQDRIRDYSEDQKEEKAEDTRSSRPRLKKRSRTILVTVAIILVASLGVWYAVSQFLAGPGPYQFGAENTNGEVPLTVTFRYDISETHSDQLMIDFGYVHPVMGSEYFLTDKSRTFLNHTYQAPGVYHPKLIWQNAAVDSAVVVVKSEGWISFYHPENPTRQYWLDNMYRVGMSPGGLTFSREQLAAYGLDTSRVYYTTHRNIRDFGISGDDFTLTAGFINGPDNGGISCYDARFSVIGEYSYSMVEFVEHNCHRYSRIKFGEKHYVGDFHDLSALTFTPGQYHEMTMEVKDKQATIFLDGDPVYEMDYEVSIGEIKGLEILFKGSGIGDFLLLTGSRGDTVYHEQFGTAMHRD